MKSSLNISQIKRQAQKTNIQNESQIIKNNHKKSESSFQKLSPCLIRIIENKLEIFKSELIEEIQNYLKKNVNSKKPNIQLQKKNVSLPKRNIFSTSTIHKNLFLKNKHKNKSKIKNNTKNNFQILNKNMTSDKKKESANKVNESKNTFFDVQFEEFIPSTEINNEMYQNKIERNINSHSRQISDSVQTEKNFYKPEIQQKDNRDREKKIDIKTQIRQFQKMYSEQMEIENKIKKVQNEDDNQSEIYDVNDPSVFSDTDKYDLEEEVVCENSFSHCFQDFLSHKKIDNNYFYSNETDFENFIENYKSNTNVFENTDKEFSFRFSDKNFEVNENKYEKLKVLLNFSKRESLSENGGVLFHFQDKNN